MKTALTLALFASIFVLPTAATADDFSTYVDSKGGISRPTNFRSNFVHLGSYAVLDEKSAARGLHDVYTEKASAEYFQKKGKFPDGATLVKEIRKFETSPMTTGNPVAWGADVAMWFVMVKDAKGRFPNNPLWGDGWGWALFEAEASSKNIAVSYKDDCMGCHVPAAKTDHVFIQGYPTLIPQ
jgi:hypothetical protein